MGIRIKGSTLKEMGLGMTEYKRNKDIKEIGVRIFNIRI